AQHCERDGVEAIIYTDIGRDGMMNGFNAESTRELAKACNTAIIASGGVSSLDDIRKLKEIEGDGVTGAVIGRALYEGTFKLSEAVKLEGAFVERAAPSSCPKPSSSPAPDRRAPGNPASP